MWSKDDDHNLRFTGRSCAEGGRVRERSRVASYRWGAYDGGSAECLVSTGGLSGVNESVGGAFPFCGGEWSSELRGRSCGCKRVWVSCSGESYGVEREWSRVGPRQRPRGEEVQWTLLM